MELFWRTLLPWNDVEAGNRPSPITLDNNSNEGNEVDEEKKDDV